MSCMLSEATMDKIRNGSSDCPRCGFPLHGKTIRIHVGRYREEFTGAMRDMMPEFHRQCGREHLLDVAYEIDETRRPGYHSGPIPKINPTEETVAA